MLSIIVFKRIGLTNTIIFDMPIIMAILGGSLYSRCTILEESKILCYISTISYHFFLCQLFLWDVSLSFMNMFQLSGNMCKIIVSFISCLAISLIMYEGFDKPIQKRIKKRSE